MEYTTAGESDATETGQTLLTSFLHALAASLTLRLDPSSVAGAHCARVFDVLNAETPDKQRSAGTHTAETLPAGALPAGALPACSYIDEAARIVAGTGAPDLIAVAETFKTLTPDIAWMHRTGLHGVVPDFADRHANGVVVGSGGLLESRHVTIGATVMAPDTTYTNHSHPPEEVYLVLSDGQWRHFEEPWQLPGIGGFVHNPPGIVHAMRAGCDPLFAIWMLA